MVVSDGNSTEAELLRGDSVTDENRKAEQLQASGAGVGGTDGNNNTNGGNNVNNNTIISDGILDDDDDEMCSVFSSPTEGGRTESTPRSRTKDHWEDETLPDDAEAKGDKSRSSRSGRSAKPGGRRDKRRASVAQRQRRDREKKQQAQREQLLREQQQQQQDRDEQRGRQVGPQPAPQQQHQIPQQQQGRDEPLNGQNEPVLAGHPVGLMGPPSQVPRHTNGPVPTRVGDPRVLEQWGGQQHGQQQQQHQQQQLQQSRQQTTALLPSGQAGVLSAMDVLTPEAVRGMSEAVNRRCAGGNGEFFDPDDTAIDNVAMEVVYAGEDDEMDTTAELNTTQVFSIRDLVNEQMEVAEGVEIRSRDIIPYVVLQWDSEKDTNWTVPDPQLFHDLVNRVESRVMEENLKCGDVLKWSNLWGKVGLLGLSAKDHDQLTAFREVIERQVTGTTKFSIYPRDALEKKGNVSVLLREAHRGLDVKQLPRAIFRRTRALKGGLKVRHVKYYREGERSRAGASKKDWRLVLLQGDAAFMSSLEKFEPEHRFWVGSDRIIIRGGERRAPPGGQQRSGGQRGSGGRPGQQQQQQHQHQHQQHHRPLQGQDRRQQQQQQHQHNQSTRGRSDGTNYERDYPSSGGLGGSGGMGSGTRSRSAGGIRGNPVWGESPSTHGRGN